MKRIALLLALTVGSTVCAEIIVPSRTIRAREIINPEDLVGRSGDFSGALSNPQDAVGQEARVVLYAGQPIRPGDVGPPAIVNRNDLVTLVFFSGPLRITTEGRALGRGAVGETMRAMNMTSHTTVTGIIAANGTIEVR